MDKKLMDCLIDAAEKNISSDDVSHDLSHAKRVLLNAQRIAKNEKADLDIIVPSALFHDIIVYPKNSKKRYDSQKESAVFAEKILENIGSFPKSKISSVKDCIMECSFGKNILASTIESKILQDADRLEATGAIAIMRTFSSSGQMKRQFYDFDDPFCKKHKPDSMKFALDLFYERLLKVKDMMNTKSAKSIAKKRADFLKKFLSELKFEIE